MNKELFNLCGLTAVKNLAAARIDTNVNHAKEQFNVHGMEGWLG